MACGRIAEVVLLIYDFSTSQTVETAECTHGTGGAARERGWEVREGCGGAMKWRGGHALLIYDWSD